MCVSAFAWRHFPQWTVVMLLILGSSVSEIQAQPIVPSLDGTGTIVTPENDRFDISGGSLSENGQNLFHSFEQFGLSPGQVANFLANPNIENILSRVIGGDVSVIDGLLQVTGGTPNLYLMNPAGIIFGNGARLDVPASFTATTATGIEFDQGVFSAFQDNDYQLLIGDPSSLIFAIVQPGAIVNAGVLSVPNLANLTLAAGQVLNLGSLSGEGVTIAALPGKSILRLTPNGRVLSLDLSLPDTISIEDFSPSTLPNLLLGTDLEQATTLDLKEDGSVWLVASENNATLETIVGSQVEILSTGIINGNNLISSDNLSLTAENIGDQTNPLLLNVNNLTTDTSSLEGDQFLLNLKDLNSINIKTSETGLISLVIEGQILDLDEELDVQSGDLKLETNTGIGTIGSPLQTNVNRIAAQVHEQGDIFIENSGDLTVEPLDHLSGLQTPSGTIVLKVNEGNLILNSEPSAQSAIQAIQIGDGGDLTLQANEITLNSNIQSGGNQTYEGNLILGTDVQLGSTQQGTILFQGTIDSNPNTTPRSLTIETGGLTQFNGAIGSLLPLASLEIDGQGLINEKTVINANQINTIAHQYFNDQVEFLQSVQLTGTDIQFLHSLESQSAQNIDLTIIADRFLAQENIGEINPFSNILIQTQNNLELQGNLFSFNNINLSSQDGFIQTRNLQTAGGNVNLETRNLNTLITSQTGIQSGDIQVDAIQAIGGTVNIVGKRFLSNLDPLNVVIESDNLSLTTENIGEQTSPLLLNINNLTADTSSLGGDQFLLNLKDLNNINLKTSETGLISLVVEGQILDLDEELDVQSGDLKLETNTGIGTIDSPLQTDVNRIAAQVHEQGDIFIENNGDLTVEPLDHLSGLQTPSGTIDFEVNEGKLSLNSDIPDQPAIQAGESGNLTLKADEILLNSNVQSGRAQTYQGNLIVERDARLTSTDKGTIMFNGTIDSNPNTTPRSLTIETGGLTQFNGAIGSLSPLANLETDGQDIQNEKTVINTNQVRTIGNQYFNDPVQISQSTQLIGTDVKFLRSLESQPEQNIDLTIFSDRFLAQENIGEKNPFSNILIQTQNNLELQGNLFSSNNINLSSQDGFIQTRNLQTAGGSVNLETLGLKTPITNQPGTQPGDIQVGAIQTLGGAVNISAKRFFRAIDTINRSSISTVGSQNGAITIVHGGQPLNRPFILGNTSLSNNGVAGNLRTNIATLPATQAFPGSVIGGNIQILAGRDNPPVNIEFIPPQISNSLAGSISSTESPLETIEDINTLEFQNAFGRDPVRQATPQEVQKLLQSINNNHQQNEDPEKFAAVYLYYDRINHEAEHSKDTIFSRGRVLRPDDPPLEEDNLSLLVVTEQEIKRIQISDRVNRVRVSQSLQLLRDRLMDPENSRGYKPFAAQLYDWIAKPITEALQDTPVDNLMFVLGRGLRSLPLAALYNRKTDQFFIEEYGLALVPSISYLDDIAVSLNGSLGIRLVAKMSNNQNPCCAMILPDE
jgi:filamentous hemagglutinin family protein